MTEYNMDVVEPTFKKLNDSATIELINALDINTINLMNFLELNEEEFVAFCMEELHINSNKIKNYLNSLDGNAFPQKENYDIKKLLEEISQLRKEINDLRSAQPSQSSFQMMDQWFATRMGDFYDNKDIRQQFLSIWSDLSKVKQDVSRLDRAGANEMGILPGFE